MNYSTVTSSSDINGSDHSLKMRFAKILRRGRFQLFIAALLGVFPPILIGFGNILQTPELLATFKPSAISGLISIALGSIIFRKIASLPGLQAMSKVIPAFMLSYAIVATIAFGLRIEISRYYMFLSYLMVVAAYLAILFLLSKINRPIIGVVPGGRANKLLESKEMRWLPLQNIQMAESNPDLAITVDLRSDSLSAEWETYVAEQVIEGRSVFNAKQLSESINGKVEIENLSENYMGHLAPDAVYAPLKHYLDVIIASIALIALSPFLLIFALLIRLDSKGPALFIQKRMGYQGRPFKVYKFRSMKNRTETSSALTADMTTSDDDRITRIGRFIRKTRIDELPQLINVIKGEMSLIGPRPETLNLSEWYANEIPFYRYRHIVRPGITGWAQVCQGHVTSIEDVREKLEYDFYYIKHFSIWLDIMIILQTLRVIITGNGAK